MKRWTQEEIKLLKEHRSNGLTYKEIGSILNRTENSVSYKIKKENLHNKYSKSSYTDEEFIIACNESTSIRQVLLKLNIIPAGGNYSTFHKKVKELNINTNHFLGKAANQGENHKGGNKGRPIESYLNNEFPLKSYNLKNRLIKENLLEYKCNICNIFNWLNNDLSLELDHIDGNNLNNNLSNLRLLCPNCHAQTPTFRRCKKSLNK